MDPLFIIKAEYPMPADFPFAFMRAQGKVRTPRVFHWHDCLELNWVAGGTGINYIADREYPLAPGQLYLINNIDRHIAVTDGSLDMRVVIFEPGLLWQASPARQEYLRAFYPVGPGASSLAALGAEDLARVAGLFGELEAEWEGQQRGYELFVRAKLMELLALLYRRLPAGMETKELALLRGNYQKIRPAINHINSHYSESLTLETLADICGMSRTYFSSLFKKTMNTNFGAYLDGVRISRACLLLSTTDLPVTEIALESGFASLSSFNAVFKRKSGKTPSQYRRSIPL